MLRDHEDRLVINDVLRLVEDDVVGDDAARQMNIAFDERAHGMFEHAFGVTAHFRDLVSEELHVLVKSRDGVLRHHEVTSAGRPRGGPAV